MLVSFTPMQRVVIKFIAVLAVAATAKSMFLTLDRLSNPPQFLVTANALDWSDSLLTTAVSGLIAFVCISYDYRRTMSERGNPELAKLAFIKWAPMWRQRRELRIVLYGIAVCNFLALPAAAFKAMSFLDRAAAFKQMFPSSPTPAPSFFAAFSNAFGLNGCVGLAIGVGLILYDRHRIRTDILRDTGHCRVCGYDLRATPDRCPECGTETLAKPSTAHA